ncbi:MAG: porin family protein [Flavobacterium sp.]|jgi:hypothetical protein|nr:porin family protein [Flavobacterium sp.]
MKKQLLFFFCILSFALFAQEQELDLPYPMIQRDSLYREDQFYIGMTYNLVGNSPTAFSQDKFSTGFSAGVLRDFPINTARTIAIAPGLGFSYQNYHQNLLINGSASQPVYSIIPTGTYYSKNKIEHYLLDLPIEFRWRTSTPESHKFWRIYSGLKLSYLLASRSQYTDGQYNVIIKNNPDFNKMQLGLYMAMGYNTWNFYGYYGLTPLLSKGATIQDDPIGLQAIHLGLLFYIL